MNSRLIGLTYAVSAAFVESVGHLWLKRSAVRHYDGASVFVLVGNALRDVWCILGLLCFAFEFGLWTLALQRLDLSLAMQLGSLSFVGVALLSKTRLTEKIDGKRLAGITLVLIGCILVGMS